MQPLVAFSDPRRHDCREGHTQRSRERKLRRKLDLGSRPRPAQRTPGPRLDLTGLRSGRLTVIGPGVPLTNKAGYPLYTWCCLCDCGVQITVLGTNLRKGQKSCNVCRYPQLVAGLRFGQFQTLRDGASKSGKRQWYCLCDCGRIVLVPVCRLVTNQKFDCKKHRKLKTFAFGASSSP